MTQHTLEFRSDNCGSAAPEILEALVRANQGTAIGYGADDLTLKLNETLSTIFETQFAFFRFRQAQARMHLPWQRQEHRLVLFTAALKRISIPLSAML